MWHMAFKDFVCKIYGQSYFQAIFTSLLYKEEKSTTNNSHDYAKSDQVIPFDYEAFCINPAQLKLSAFIWNTNEAVYFTNTDFTSEEALTECAQTSSGCPIIMTPKRIKGRVCYNSEAGEGRDIMIPKAYADKFARFFVIRTRPKSFRKPEHLNHTYDLYFDIALICVKSLTLGQDNIMPNLTHSKDLKKITRRTMSKLCLRWIHGNTFWVFKP